LIISFLVGLIAARFLKIIIFKSKLDQTEKFPLLSEVFFAIALMLFYIKYGFSVDLFFSWIILCYLLLMFLYDLFYGIIPDWLNFSGLLLGLVFGLLETNFITSVLGTIIGFSVMYIIYTFSCGGMGGGDVKAAAMIGAFLGSKYVLLALWLAFVIGAVIGVFLVITGRKRTKSPIAFGPFLAIGTYITMLYGNRIIECLWKI